MYKRWWGNDRNEYVSQLERFDRVYERFMLLHGEFVDHNVEKFINRVNATLHSPKFNRQSVEDLYHFAHQLEMECDDELFLQFLIKRSSMFFIENFSKELAESVSVSIDTRQYNSAIVEAFKAFEEKLTGILGV